MDMENIYIGNQGVERSFNIYVNFTFQRRVAFRNGGR
jgi:hypothetical protein